MVNSLYGIQRTEKMAISNTYNASVGTQWHGSMPSNPVLGDCYMDILTMSSLVYTGTTWIQIGGESPKTKIETLIPTQEQLNNHPALKQAWEEYVILRRLIG